MFPLLFLALNITENMGTTCWQTCLQFQTLLSNPLIISVDNFNDSKSRNAQHFTASCQFPMTKCLQWLQTYKAGKQKPKSQQTWPEPISTLQHIPSYKITTQQRSKHRMFIEINYSLRAFFFFFFWCWIILNKQRYWRAEKQNKFIGSCCSYWYTALFPRHCSPWATKASISRIMTLLVGFLLTSPNERNHSPIKLIPAVWIITVLVLLH